MLTSILALVVTAFVIEVARRFAPAIGLIDSPCDRKSHKGEIPLVGGIGIFAGIVLVLGFSGALVDQWAYLLAAGLLVAVGICDDSIGMSPLLRLVIQAGSVFLVAAVGGTYISDLGQILPVVGTVELGWMAIPFTVFVGVGLINAFNMSDGVDGLCGTLTLVALTGLGVAAGLGGRESVLVLILALSGGVVGFLVFNIRLPQRKQAVVFLGDAGSYLLGLSVLYLVIRLSQGPNRAIDPVTALWFCMVPLLDTVGMILRRTKRGISPFSPDREHIHHVFLLAKFSVTTTWIGLTLVATAGMVFGMIGLVSGIPESLMLVTFLVVGVLYYAMITRAWKVLRFLSRSINRRAMARFDRRVGPDRRRSDEVYYVDGIPRERRSGRDRRHGNGDRRIIEDDIPAALMRGDANADARSQGGKAGRTT